MGTINVAVLHTRDDGSVGFDAGTEIQVSDDQARELITDFCERMGSRPGPAKARPAATVRPMVVGGAR